MLVFLLNPWSFDGWFGLVRVHFEFFRGDELDGGEATFKRFVIDSFPSGACLFSLGSTAALMVVQNVVITCSCKNFSPHSYLP